MVTVLIEPITGCALLRVPAAPPARRKSLLRTVAALAAIAVLASCANPEDTTRAEGVGVGAALGALAGGLIGGRNGALIGAGIGGGLGLLGAEVVNYKRREYANNEDRLSGEQRIAMQNLKAVQDYNNQLVAHIAQLDRQAAALRQAQAAGQSVNVQLASAQNEAANEARRARSKLADVDRAITESERNLALANAASTPAEVGDVARLQKEVAAMEQERNRLRAGVDRLEAAESRL
jgi:predicted lipid-binding transport protein (Tim44 family)